MTAVLMVGVATLDIVCELPAWPREDSETRADGLRQARGGNAANSAVALRRLGDYLVDWFGTLGGDAGAALARADFAAHGVGCAHAVVIADGVTPSSCVWLNRASGTRTIVHYRDLREPRAGEFRSLPLSAYGWIHFEGRNVSQLGAMLDAARAAGARVSLEIEKPRDGIEALWPRADVLLFSRHYARSRGYSSAAALLDRVARSAPRAELFCAWGPEGAAWRGADGEAFASAPLVRAIDTLGAGDVFNAAVIHGLIQRRPAPRVLETACRIAAEKCTQTGFKGVRDE